MTAGDIRIEDVRGNKDIELHAGDVRIDVGRAEDYNSVDASVWAGDIKAEPFNTIKGGLFRSFEWNGHDPYRLHARLKAGDLRLYRKPPYNPRVTASAALAAVPRRGPSASAAARRRRKMAVPRSR